MTNAIDKKAQTIVADARRRATFEMNGSAYATDEETLNVLRSIVPAAKASGDVSAVALVMELGLRAGRIEKLALQEV